MGMERESLISTIVKAARLCLPNIGIPEARDNAFLPYPVHAAEILHLEVRKPRHAMHFMSAWWAIAAGGKLI